MEFLRPILVKIELICQQPAMTRPIGVIGVRSPAMGSWIGWLGADVVFWVWDGLRMGHLSIESYLCDCLMIWTPGSNLFWNTFSNSNSNSKRFIETHTYIQQSYTMTVSRCLQTLSTRCKQKCIKFLYSETSESMRILEAVKGLYGSPIYLAL